MGNTMFVNSIGRSMLKSFSRLVLSQRRSISSDTTKNFQRTFPQAFVKRIVNRTVWTGIIGGTLYYYYLTRNKYPPTVKKQLRQGLWQERKFQNNELSLKHFIDALKECQNLQMDNLSDEFTGIEIKMAEVYERMELYEDANKIYEHMMERFIYNLNDINRKIKTRRRKQLIKRDLSILVKYVKNDTHMKDNHQRNYLIPLIQGHLKVAEDQAYSEYPALKDFITKENDSIMSINNTMYTRETLEENKPKFTKFMNIFGPFQEEYFVTRDLYTEIFLNQNKIEDAIKSKLVTIGWMILCGRSQGEVLLSQVNIGSFLYLKAEQLENDSIKIRKIKQPSEKTNELADKLESSRIHLLDTSTQYYENVIAKAGKSKKRYIINGYAQDNNTLQAIALSTYGLGVINLHRGKFTPAANFLQEAYEMAEDIGFQELQMEAKNELQKINSHKPT